MVSLFKVHFKYRCVENKRWNHPCSKSLQRRSRIWLK